MNEDDIGTFRPPEPALRVGVRDSSYLNYRAWGYISEDERILLSDEGEVYLKMDEVTFESNNTLRMIFDIASDETFPLEKKILNRDIGLKRLINQGIRTSMLRRVLGWLASGRLGK